MSKQAMAKRIFVTGARGYLGNALVAHLSNAGGYDVIASARSWGGCAPNSRQGHIERHVGDLSHDGVDWRVALAGVDTIVHCAALVHDAGRAASDADFMRVNATATQRLAQHASDAGVRRFVLVSSIAVHGRSTDIALCGTSPSAPADAYARSKLAAEQALVAVCAGSGMQAVIVRPPVVYGAGAPGNVAQLAQLVRRGVPLPMGRRANRRSLIGIDNLVDALACCLVHPAAAQGPLLLADSEVVSTRELVRLLADSMDCAARAFTLPDTVLRAGAHLLGRPALAASVLDSLWVANVDARRIGWQAPLTLAQGLARCV